MAKKQERTESDHRRSRVVAREQQNACHPGRIALAEVAREYLLDHELFLPYDTKPAATAQQRLTAVVAAANRAGYSIRVAVNRPRYEMDTEFDL